MTDTITRPQIAKIWASAHEIGLDRETLYLLVPGGSISNLTRNEASALIERLAVPDHVGNAFHRPTQTRLRVQSALRQKTSASVTDRQRRFITALFNRLGWSSQPNRIRGFLKKFAGVESVAELRRRKRAIALIEALKAMVKRSKRKQPRRN